VLSPKLKNLFDQGVRRSDAGDFEGAAAVYRRVIGMRPDIYQAHFNLGLALIKSGRDEEALVPLQRVIEIQPNHLKAINYLANALHDLGNLKDSIRLYRRALKLNSRDPRPLANLAVALAGSGHEEEAMENYQRALALAPDLATVHHNLGNLVRKLKGDDEAIPHYARAVELDPDYSNAWANWGAASLKRMPKKAARCFRKALSREPDHSVALGGLLAIEQRYCDFDAQEETYARALETLKNESFRKWSSWQSAANFMYRAIFAPFPLKTMQALQDHIALKLEPETRARGSLSKQPAPKEADDRRLRVGYLSPNFGDHPVGQVTLSLFPAHDRHWFQVHGFSTRRGGSDGSDIAAKHRIGFDVFHEIGDRKDKEAAEYIRSVGIDILIDLDGYMDNTSPPIMAFRPAPLQIFWLGHAGGLGLSFVDYLIADAMVVPPGEEGNYREAVVRLPDVYHCADRFPVEETCPPRQAWGLPDNAMVYCVFNNPEKIDRRVFECWMRILQSVDHGVLWFSSFRQHREILLANLRRYAERQGVDPDRLILSERVPEKSVHFARIGHADLMLDTLTLNASTTALDSLWSGVPLLAVRGDRFSNRISNSMLHAIGLDDLVCADLDEYERRAIELGKDPTALCEIRQRLRANRETTPLFDIQSFVRNLESAYATMWDRHCRGEPPVGFDVLSAQHRQQARRALNPRINSASRGRGSTS
jgi:predicted O-linked N-acetylglucosamine transferase (SPINDLY family)